LLQGEQQLVVGKSYDWNQDEGLVLFNKAGVQKRALVFDPRDRPATWVSRYASLTFNQYGREMPNGGMNTAGLVVEVMWLNGSEYPPQDSRPVLNELQWIQYQLDRFSTVSEMVAHAPTLRVSKVYAPVHYMACDKTGGCAAFEYLYGALVVTYREGAPVRVLTNHPHGTATQHLRGASTPEGTGSLARFTIASRATSSRRDDSSLYRGGFELLQQVSQGEHSKWRILYDPMALKVYFQTYREAGIKRIDLSALDPSCQKPVQMLDMHTGEAGDAAARFSDYATASNEALLMRTTASIHQHLPAGAVSLVARYPETLRCGEP
jgi:choloylglycine hydrolase